MIAGLGVTCWYMGMTQPWLRGLLGVTRPRVLWWGIEPISAGVFGVAAGFAAIALVSLLTPEPAPDQQNLALAVRYPRSGELAL